MKLPDFTTRFASLRARMGATTDAPLEPLTWKGIDLLGIDVPSIDVVVPATRG